MSRLLSKTCSIIILFDFSQLVLFQITYAQHVNVTKEDSRYLLDTGVCRVKMLLKHDY